MRTRTATVGGPIAIRAQDPEAFREATPSQPCIERIPNVSLMLGPAAADVVNGKKHFFALTTTRALASVGLQNSRSEGSVVEALAFAPTLFSARFRADRAVKTANPTWNRQLRFTNATPTFLSRKSYITHEHIVSQGLALHGDGTGTRREQWV